MRLPLRRVIDDLRGRSGRRFVELLGGHVESILDGARLVDRAARGEIDWAEARRQMRDVEHRGDRLRESLIHELSMAITTPIDREDVARVSRSIDDVLDNLRDCVRLCDLLQIGEAPLVVPVVESVSSAVLALRDAIAAIVAAPGDITRRASVAGKAGHRIRRAYDYALAELLRGEVDMDVLKQREVLRRLDIVGLRLGEAADALADAAVKRSAS